jgi:diguanylate cyclase (GGDEF)-like protein/PAS domain S-box-containing protein
MHPTQPDRRRIPGRPRHGARPLEEEGRVRLLALLAGMTLVTLAVLLLTYGDGSLELFTAWATLAAVAIGALGLAGVRLTRTIREREGLARSILDAAHEPFISIDREGRIVEWSPQAERDFGWARQEAIGRPVSETILPADDRPHYIPGLERLLGGDRRMLGRRIEITAARRDGSRFPVELIFFSLKTSRGTRFSAFLRDITERREADEALRRADQRFRSAFDNAPIGMAIVSTEGRFLRTNRALSELTGYPQDHLAGMGLAEITHSEDLSKDLSALQDMVDGARDRYQTEMRYLHADGHVIWVDLSSTIVRDRDGRPMYLLSQMQDISERKQTEARLAHRASHDELTGLPRRAVLEERTVLALNRQRRERKPVAMLYMDLDRFKVMNDTYGHEAGDRLLVAIAKRLGALVRPTDVVSRVGGDEFVILCEGMGEAAASRLAKRIIEVVSEPIDFEGVRLSVKPSVGIALTRDPETSPSELLYDADAAMYFAKGEARFGFAMYKDKPRRRNGSARTLDTQRA